MYSPQAGSPATELADNIDDVVTTIPVVDVSVLPEAPNILTLVSGDEFESIIYQEVDSATNELKQVTRGVEGTAQSWTASQEIARNFTARDLKSLQNNLISLQIPTFNVVNFKVLGISTTGDQAEINWSNPPNLRVQDEEDNFITLAEFAGVKVIRKDADYPADINDGTEVYDGTGESYTDTGLTEGETYYYSAFAYTTDDVYSEPAQDSAEIVARTLDLTYNVTGFSASGSSVGGGEIQASWTNPTEEDFEGVLIRYSTTAYPTDVNEGTLGYDGVAESVTITGLNNDTDYYLTVWAYNDSNQYSADEINELTTVQIGEEFGLEWNQTTDSYMRLDDASTLEVTDAGTSGYKTGSDFDTIEPWASMERVNLADDGTVNARYGDAGYETDGSNGQVMVEIPKFYRKSENDTATDNIYRWWISYANMEGYEVHPAFIQDGVEKDYIYFSAFEGNVDSGVMRSIANVQPSTDTNVADGTIAGFRGYAQARGVGWELQTYYATNAIQMLYLIEYADFNTQERIGEGITGKDSGSGNESENTGATTGNDSYGDPNDDLVAVSYRGIENFWGNIWKWVDGLNINNYSVYTTNYDFESDKFTGNYELLGSVLSTSDTYIKDIYSSYSFLATEGGATSSTYLTDFWWIDSGERVARFGGTWNTGSQAGGFCWSLGSSSADASRFRGSRLLYIN